MPVSFDTFYEFSQNSNTSRHSLKLQKERVHTELYHFFTERAINLWNSLDEESLSAVSVNGFKSRWQKLLMDGSFPRLIKETLTGKILRVRTDSKILFSRTFQDLQRPNSRVFQDSQNSFSTTFQDKFGSQTWLHNVQKVHISNQLSV